MNIQVFTKDDQAYGAFNGGEIIENKPVGFPREGGKLKPFSNLFYWANAIAKVDSTIGLHPHKGFEIMSFVISGGIRHFDTKLNTWKDLSEGDVQIIRAGNGISHSEFMEKDSRMFQIWLDPDLQKTLSQEASYDDYRKSDFPVVKSNTAEVTTLIGEGSPLGLDTADVETLRIKILNSPYTIKVKEERVHAVYILSGEFSISGSKAATDDFVLIEDTEEISFEGVGEVFLFSSPKEVKYQTYAKSMKG